MIARGVNTRSGWDTVLEGTEFETGLAGADIQAGVGEKAKADAKIILQGIKTTVQKEESSKSNAVVWQSMAGSGSVVETLALPKFEGPTPPKLSAADRNVANTKLSTALSDGARLTLVANTMASDAQDPQGLTWA